MKVHAKRCEKFLSKPELQSLLIKRKISTSKNQTAKVSGCKEKKFSVTEEIHKNEYLLVLMFKEFSGTFTFITSLFNPSEQKIVSRCANIVPHRAITVSKLCQN